MQAADIVSQIIGCTTFFNTQGQLLQGDLKTESEKGMGSSVCLQISNLASLDMNNASEINKAIRDSAFPSEQKTLLAQAVQKKLMASATNTTTPNRKGLQTLTSVCSYFTQNDWNCMGNPTLVLGQKIICMVERLRLLGLGNPSESTSKHLAALIGTVHFQHPDASQLHNIVLELKLSMQQMRGKVVLASGVHILQYPTDPKELPEAVFKLAYPNDADPPINNILDGFMATFVHVPLRVTNKTLSSTPRASPTQSADSSNSINMVGALLQQLLSARGDDAGLPNLVIHPSRGPTRAAQFLRRQSSSGQLALSSNTLGFDGVGSEAIAEAASGNKTPLSVDDSQDQGASSDKQHVARESAGAHLAVADVPACDAEAKHVGTKMPLQTIDQIVNMAAGTDKDMYKDVYSGLSKSGKGKGKAKAKAKTEPKSKAAAKVKTKSKTKAAPKAKVEATYHGKKALMLGCGKCRGSPKGCSQCRDPSFGGKRWQRK